MAFYDPSFAPTRPTLRARIARLFETEFDRKARRLSDEVAALRALSDDALARRGIARDDILFHVFVGARR
ncbi:hypothetical protein [Cognatishimia sp. F0-27]|uniref:hypothetical protein n=1 Tax=Cognatishimia sp. F0-27 TaxID=2816855 RepID=UPI001D0CD663|nr:hypothetical protein [Cognatishimia sp. F0-27]MCC1494575.1 hypothetical protein [Cognatishimia sp. F0-27]